MRFQKTDSADSKWHDPVWLDVVGGPPPSEVVLRELLLTLLVPLFALFAGLWLSPVLRLLLFVASGGLALGVFMLQRALWRRGQKVRVLGTVLEHSNGQQVVRVALTRAVLSTAAAPDGYLVLVLDDGNGSVRVARRADDAELSDLPPIFGSYLELTEDDFESVRYAAQRSYAQA